MPHFQRHVFVCTNRRDPTHPRGSCAARGSEALCQAFKQALREQGLGSVMRANSSGCLDQCEQGPTVVVYPEQVWYQVQTADDVRDIVNQHLVEGRPVERLRMKDLSTS